MLKKTAYAAIRKCVDEDREWLSLPVYLTPQEVEESDRGTAKLIPSWDKANPVQRIAKVEITEVVERSEPRPKQDDPEIAKQLEFVEWLKERGIYNPYASAHEMRQCQRIWEEMQK